MLHAMASSKKSLESVKEVSILENVIINKE